MFLVLATAGTLFAQAPANDACGNATVLTLGAAATSGTNVNATATSEPAKPSCWANANDPNNTVWYQFTTTTAGTYTVTLVSGSGIRGLVEGLSGTCAALTSIGCADAGAQAATATMPLTGLAATTTYYIRVDGQNAQTGTFTIAVSGPSSASGASDDCATAQNINVQSGFQSYNNTGSTGGEPVPSCWTTDGDGVADNTIWIKFTTGALGGTHTITTDDGTGTDTHIALYSGSCGTLTEIGCSEDIDGFPTFLNTSSEIVAAGLAPNTTYYIMADLYDTGTVGAFSLRVDSAVVTSGGTCAGTTEDCCANAIELTVDDPCMDGSNVGATIESGERTANDCWLSPPDATVWYKFTTGTAGTYVITTSASTNTSIPPVLPPADTELKLFTGSCGSFTLQGCSEWGVTVPVVGSTAPSAILQASLAANTEYYIQVDTRSAQDAFCIAVNYVPATTPALLPNDECPGAFNIVMNEPCVLGEELGNDNGGTFSNNANDPWASCFGSAQSAATTVNTVWFKFNTASDTAAYTVTVGSYAGDIQYALWGGSCGSLQQIDCKDEQFAGFEETGTYTLPPNKTYYISTSEFVVAGGPFCITVTGPTPDTVENDCPFNLPTKYDITNQLYSVNNTTTPFACNKFRYTNGGPAPNAQTVANDAMACDSTDRLFQDVWFTFTITAPAPNAWLDVYEYTEGGIAPDYVAALYSGTPTGTCNSGNVAGLTYIDCSSGLDSADGSASGGSRDMTACSATFPRINVATLAPGTYYYRVWHKAAPPVETGVVVPTPFGNITFNSTTGGAVYNFSQAFDLSLCVESSTPDPISKDNCSEITANDYLSKGQGCGTLPNYDYAVSTTNLNNTGKMGRQVCTTGQEPTRGASTAIGDERQACTGVFGPATASNDAGVGFTNSAIYAFEVKPCNTNSGLAKLRFSNITYGGLYQKGIRVQVVKDLCTSTTPVMYGTTSQSCYELRDTLPSGVYYVIVDGQMGQLAKYDLSVDVDYGILTQTSSHKPVAKFSRPGNRTEFCVNEDVTFTFNGDLGFGTGINPGTVCSNGNTVTYEWTIPGGVITAGSTSTPSVTVHWTSASNRQIKLVVKNMGCVSDTEKLDITIRKASSDFNVAFSQGCVGTPINSSYAGDAPVGATYKWDFGANANPAMGNAQAQAGGGGWDVSWSTPGTKTISLVVTDNGCVSDTTKKTVIIYAVPTATFNVSASNICEGQKINITYTGTAGLTNDTTFTWTIDGTSVPISLPSNRGPHQNVYWSDAGTKDISLFVSEHGCRSNTVTRTVTVTAAPDFSIVAPAKVCEGTTYPFTVDNIISGATYAWSFDAGSTATPAGLNASTEDVSWSSSGVKVVSVGVTSGSCATVTKTININVLPAPVAAINLAKSTICFDEVATIDASPTTASSYAWNFAQGTNDAQVINGSGFGPYTVKWPAAGTTRTITLSITDANGCVSAATSKVINIAKKVDIAFGNITQPNPCGTSTGIVEATGTTSGVVDDPNADYSYLWNTGATTRMISGLPSGVYNVQATRLSDNCMLDSAYALNDAGAPSLTIGKIAQPTCSGKEDGSIDIDVVSGGTGPFTYTISPDPNGAGSNSTGVFSNLGAGDYTVEVVDVTGCKGTIAVEMLDKNPVLVDLGTGRQVCSGEVVQLSPSVTGGSTPYKYIWSTTDPNTSSSIDVTVVSDTTITLQVQDVNGCTSALSSVTYTLKGALASDFVLSDDSICLGQSVTVEYQGPDGVGATFSWDGDGATASPSFADNPGPYTLTWSTFSATKDVTLQLANSGCVSTTVKKVTIIPEPSAEFIISNINPCANENVVVTYSYPSGQTVSTGTTFSWNFDVDGTPVGGTQQGPYTVSWSGSGIKTITLDVVNECGSASVQKSVDVKPTPDPVIDVPDPVCVNDAAIFSTSSSGAIWQWEFSGASPANANGQGPHSVTWANAGPFNVKLTILENGCAAVDAETFVVRPLPSASFDAPTEVCANDPAELTYTGGAGNGSVFDWQFPNATPTSSNKRIPDFPVWDDAHTGTQTATLEVTDPNGCISIPVSKDIKVNGLPTSKFTMPASVCQNVQVPVVAEFIKAVPTDNVTYIWTWTADADPIQTDLDGRTYDVSWKTTGTKEVKLKVQDNNTCISQEYTATIEVTGTPAADFTVSGNPCTGKTLTFTHEGLESSSATYAWDFDGASTPTATTKGPHTVSWATSGTKKVTLTISDGGCTSEMNEMDVVIGTTPFADFSVSDNAICFDQLDTVDFTGTVENVDATDFQWDFGLDSVIVDKKANQGPYTLSWKKGGSKTLSLVVVEYGCVSDTAKKTVTVSPEIVLETDSIDASPCGSSTGAATVKVIGDVAGNYDFVWSTTPPRTGQTITGIPAGTYTVTGTNKVTGCKATALAAVSDRGAPSVVVDKQDVKCNGENTGSAAAIATGGSGQYSYQWNTIPVQTTSTVNNLLADEYTVEVNDVNTNCKRTVTFEIAEPNPLIISAGADQIVCSGTPTTFNGSADGGVSPFNYNWSTGDKTQSVIVSPGVTTGYNLSVIDDNGCTKEDSVYAIINETATANFSVSSTQVPVSTDVTITYTGSASSLATFSWKFDGGVVTSGSGAGPYTVRWNSTGSKVVRLTVTDNGCTSLEESKTVTVTSCKTATFTAPATICVGKLGTITYTGNGGTAASYDWSFGSDYNIISGSGKGPYSVSWNSVGVRNISLTVTENGCPTTVTRQIDVKDAPTSTFTVSSPVCSDQQATITYTGNATAGATYNWDFGGASALPGGSLQGPQLATWTTTGTKYVKLIVSEGGCSSELTTVGVVVRPTPDASFSITSGTSNLCFGDKLSVQLTSAYSNFTDYDWDFDGADVLTGKNEGPFDVEWNTSGVKTIKLQTTLDGCSNSITKTVTVRTKIVPVATITKPSTCGTADGILSVNVSGGNSPYNATLFNDPYANPESTFSGVTSFSKNALGRGVYSVGITDQVGCSMDTTFTISDPGAATLNLTASDETCPGFNNGLAKVVASPVASYDYQWFKMSGTNKDTLVGENVDSVKGLTPGNYIVEVLEPISGCLSTAAIEINEAVPFIITAGSDVKLCAGSDLNVSVRNTGGQLPISYRYDPISSYTNSSSYTFSGIKNDSTIVVDAFDNRGCISSDAVGVFVKPVVSVAIKPSRTQICFGQTITINETAAPASAAFTWDFDGAKVTPSTTTGKGPYTLQWNTSGPKLITLSVTDNTNYCTAPTVDTGVLVNPLPSALFKAVSNEACTGNPFAFSYTGNAGTGSTFAWTFASANPSTSTDQNPSNVVWSTGGSRNVTLKVTDANGCSSPLVTQSILIKTTPKDSFIVTSPVCVDGNATVTFKGTLSPTNNYDWNFDGGKTVGPGQKQGPYTITWATPGTKNITLSVSNNGCASAQPRSIPVLVNDRPAVDFSAPTVICPNDSALVQFSAAVSNNPVYNWNFNGAKIAAGDPTGQDAGPYKLKWNVANATKTVSLSVLADGCLSKTVSKDIKIEEKPEGPDFSNAPTKYTYCKDQPSQPFVAGAKGGTLRWYGTNPNGPPVANDPPKTDVVGTFYYYVSRVARGSSGVSCESDKYPIEVVIQKLDDPYFKYVADTFCKQDGSPVPTVILTPGGTFRALTNPPGLAVDSRTGQILMSATQPGGPYGVIYTTPSGAGKCPNSDTVYVVVQGKPDIAFGYGVLNTNTDRYEFCKTDTNPPVVYRNAMHPAGQFSYNQSTNPGLSLNATTGAIDIQKSKVGTYEVTFIAPSGNVCSDAEYTVTVKIKSTPKVEIYPSTLTETCVGTQELLGYIGDASQFADYTWEFGPNATIPGSDKRVPPVVSWTRVGQETVKLTVSENGCTDSASRTFDVLPVPVADFVTDIGADPDTAFNINDVPPITFFPVKSNQGNPNYIWDFDNGLNIERDQQPTFLYDKVGVYSIHLTVTVGNCSVDTVKGHIVITDERKVYVPNAFSPNGDGMHDILKLQAVGMKNYTIEIYNRWGQMVYTGTETSTGWDGLYLNELATEGVYVYVIKGKTITGNKVYSDQGYVMLLK